MTRIVLETKVDPHDPALYRADQIAQGIDGFANIDDALLERFRRDGYLLVHAAYTPDETRAARGELDAMTHSDDPRSEAVYFEGSIRDALADRIPPGKQHAVSGALSDLALGQTGDRMPDLPPDIRAQYVRKFHGFSEHHPPLRAMRDKPELIALIERIAGEPVAPLQEMALIKPPNGREKPWHQDHAYFNYPLDTPIVGVWIALDDVTPENGCMHLLAGAHIDGPRIHWRRRDWQLCDTETLAPKHTAAPMRAGDALIFDSKLPHGTPMNRSDGYRWALQYHYIAASAIEMPDAARLAIFGSEGKDVTC